MAISALTPRAATPRTKQARVRAKGTPTVGAEGSSPARPARPVELDTITARWQRALDTAESALSVADRSLPAPDLGRRRSKLRQERQETAELLVQLARATGVRPIPWLSPVTVTPRSLGLAPNIKAGLFDIDGVLTDSNALHAWAWGEAFDEFLLRLTEKTGWNVIPFDRTADYEAFMDGRSRLDGIHAFLASRGIRVDEGRIGDPIEAGTAQALAGRKGELLAGELRRHGVTALAGARRYLEAAGCAGLARAVVSASANTLPMLDVAGFAHLIESRIDADVISTLKLRPRPAPDALLIACRRLGVRPADAVTFTHSPAGVVAGLAAGLAVIGVGDEAHRDLLRDFGAERIVPSLRALLDRRLTNDGYATH